MGLFILTFGLIFAINFATKRSPALALVLFYAFTLLMGVEVGPLIKSYLHVPGGQVVVFQAALTTAVGMFALGLVAQVARFDYRKVYNYAFAALIGLVVLGVLSMFVHFISPGSVRLGDAGDLQRAAADRLHAPEGRCDGPEPGADGAEHLPRRAEYLHRSAADLRQQQREPARQQLAVTG